MAVKVFGKENKFALGAGSTSTETDNSPGFVPSDTSIDALREDDTE